MKKIGALAAGAAFGVMASWVGPSAQAAEVSSTWSTEFGKLDMTVTDGLRVSGTYPDYRGRVRGTLSESGEIYVYWLQPESGVRCQTEVYGTYYWGIVLWDVQANGDLEGRWSYCDEAIGTQGTWNGRLTAGPSPMVIIENASKGGSNKQVAGSNAGSNSGGNTGGSNAETTPEDAVLDLLDALIRNARNN